MIASKNPTHRWLRVILAAVIACAILTGAAAWYAWHNYSPLTRDYVIKTLEDRYRSDVEMTAFHATLFPQPKAVAEGLIFHARGRTDMPPLVTIRKLTIEAGLISLFQSPRHIDRVSIEGLELDIAPRKEPGPKEEANAPQGKTQPPNFLVSDIIADGTLLKMLPRDPSKPAKHFEIRQLRLRSVGLGQPLTFVSTLTNYKPPGEIHSEGKFGPWDSDDPGATPVSGKYTFRDADLGVFHGIAGTLSSDGQYSGVLNRIDVDGATDTPNFLLTESGHPVDLKTVFHATVDGTSGDTFLDPVDARFLNSRVLARGGVYRKAGVQGRTIDLDVDIENARVEDLLLLALKSQAPLTGAIRFQSKLSIPPDPAKVIDKLYLDGNFSIGAARFSSLDIQQKVTTLSERARGQTENDPADRVVSNMRGHFQLNRAAATFSTFSFSVPGSLIALNGSYGLRSEELNFEGTAQMDAKLSQMTTGVKSKLLKVVDPFFRREGKTVIPIRITGTRSQPSFGLRFGGR